MAKSQTKGLRLTLEDWAEVEYAAKIHGWGRNDEIKDRIHRLAVEMPEEVADGQTSLDLDCFTGQGE